MKPTLHLQACLFLGIGVLAGCDANTSPNGAGNPGLAATTTLVGVWTSPTDVITLRNDGTATDLYSDSTNARFRYSGTWSASANDLTLDLPRVDSSVDGSVWLQVPGDTGEGWTLPFFLDGNTLVLDTGASATTYTRSVSGTGSTFGSVSAPVFSAPSGTYSGVQLVTITCATSGAMIYYTVDGSYPTTSSWRYNGAIQVGASTTIRAVAISTNATSTVTSVEYTIQTGGPSTTGALVGIWKGIFAYSLSGTGYQDTVELTLYSGGNLYWTRYYSEADPTFGDVVYSSQSASGTWSATPTQINTTMDGVTNTGAYSLTGNALTIVDARWTPTTQTFQRQ